jgi:putative Holliday junction resolvase
MRVLGLDLGTRRIGVAISDELGITAQPLTTLRRGSLEEDCAALGSLIAAYGVGEIVVGLPRGVHGELGRSGEACAAYGRELQQRLGIPVTFWDERLSTAAAERSLLEADLRRGRRRRVIDQVAACWILGGYLLRRHNGGW